ncbi:MAG TPA: response regulator transcription factor [Gammaproteobacteria bacterium]|nr:response regulator transcription factor [Gammaproteobacteria bacterium]
MGLEEEKKQESEHESIKVLIADDDAPTRILLRAAVSRWGYVVVEAADGEEAWEIIQKPDVPQMLIVDWLMPKLDGIDLCRRVKKEIKHYPYIILLTQLSGTTNIVKGLEAGADEFLSKPFNMAELQSRLSVGARIIHYKAKLAETNERFKSYYNQANELSSEIKGISNKVDAIISECSTMGDNPKNQHQIAKLNELHEDFKRIIEGIDKLSIEHQQESDDS